MSNRIRSRATKLDPSTGDRPLGTAGTNRSRKGCDIMAAEALTGTLSGHRKGHHAVCRSPTRDDRNPTHSIARSKGDGDMPIEQHRSPRIDFRAINAEAHSALTILLTRWLPDGRVQGREYVSLNPRRVDRHLGSFRINLLTGKWADFATGAKGGDVVSLAAYLFGLSQAEAARRLAHMLGVRHG